MFSVGYFSVATGRYIRAVGSLGEIIYVRREAEVSVVYSSETNWS
jgi:hypothetical protein